MTNNIHKETSELLLGELRRLADDFINLADIAKEQNKWEIEIAYRQAAVAIFTVMVRVKGTQIQRNEIEIDKLKKSIAETR
jgi:hypothetical protein